MMHSDHLNHGLASEEKGCLAAFGAWFVVVVVIMLAVVGVSIWAIIHLVNWITSQ